MRMKDITNCDTTQEVFRWLSAICVYRAGCCDAFKRAKQGWELDKSSPPVLGGVKGW